MQDRPSIYPVARGGYAAEHSAHQLQPASPCHQHQACMGLNTAWPTHMHLSIEQAAIALKNPWPRVMHLNIMF